MPLQRKKNQLDVFSNGFPTESGGLLSMMVQMDSIQQLKNISHQEREEIF